MRTISFDGVIVGGGGAGMRAALQLAQSGYKTAVISKVFPTRSHTVSRRWYHLCDCKCDPQDDWRWHMYDTVKGSDYIGDQDAIEYMCSVGPEAIFELEHMGLPFSRTEEGRIYQRRLAVSPRIMVKAVRRLALAQLRTEQAMRCFTRSTKQCQERDCIL